MKKTAAIIATACAATFAYGQGTVLVENVNGSKIIPIWLADGTTQVKGATFSAALQFGGAQQGAIYPFAANGRFTSGSAVTLTGTKEGGTASGLTLQVWDNTTGASYAAATLKGTSAAFDNPLGGGTTPPPKLINLPSFSLSGTGPGPTTPGPEPTPGPVIPEPSTIALGVLGAAALLFRFRK